MNTDTSKTTQEELLQALFDLANVPEGELRQQASQRPAQDAVSADQFASHVLWLGDEPMLPERSYRGLATGQDFGVQVTDLTYEIDQQSKEHLAAKVLEKGRVAYCKIALDAAVPVDPQKADGTSPVVLFLDSAGGGIVGIGVIDFALRRSTNISWHQTTVDQAARARVHNHQPCVVWFTGLSGSGKSTVANVLEQKLHSEGRHTYLLDGDNVRHGLCRDLGFTDADRVENIRRVAEVARLMADAGLIVIASFISPFANEREMARLAAGDILFVEAFVDTPLAVCESRDPKGLYKKARTGELKNFTGIDSAYEAPSRPEITLHGAEHTPEVLADQVAEYLSSKNVFSV